MNWENLIEGDVVVTARSTYVVIQRESPDLLHVLYIEGEKVIGIIPSKLFRLRSSTETVYRNGERVL